jgi:hypothetical protein
MFPSLSHCLFPRLLAANHPLLVISILTVTFTSLGILLFNFHPFLKQSCRVASIVQIHPETELQARLEFSFIPRLKQ